jgi:hypothetical protein
VCQILESADSKIAKLKSIAVKITTSIINIKMSSKDSIIDKYIGSATVTVPAKCIGIVPVPISFSDYQANDI